MEKIFLYLFCGLVAINIVSCDNGNDPVDPVESQKEVFTVSNKEVKFTIFGGTAAIAVTGKDNTAVEITVTHSGTWFEWDEKEGAITISAPVNESGAHEGSITVSAKGYEDAVIEVSQAAPAPILWDNPSAYYMNLKGGVKTVSFHDYLMRDVAITELVFNEGGWITSFKTSNKTVSVKYDANNRISEIESQGTGSMKLTYGTHEKYISTEDLFFKEMAYSFGVLEYAAWMPLYIKDLSKVELTDNNLKTHTYELVMDGDAGACVGDGDNDSPVFTFKTSNGFISESTYGSGFYAATSKLNVDHATGKLSSIVIEDMFGDMVYSFNNDRINTFAKVESDDLPAEATYNTNLDPASISGSSVDEYEYSYDNHNNWTSRSKNGVVDQTREITYLN